MSDRELGSPDDLARMPYQLSFPAEAQQEIVVPAVIPEDERNWVPQADNVWFRPLCLNAGQGYWVNLLRVRRAGILSRHRHPAPVHAHRLGASGLDPELGEAEPRVDERLVLRFVDRGRRALRARSQHAAIGRRKV